MAYRQKAIRWVETGTVAANTNWFDDDIKGSEETITRDIIGIAPGGNSKVNIIAKYQGITKTFQLNEGSALAVDEFFAVTLNVWPTMTYNIQHATGTQNPTVIITRVTQD